MGIFELSNVAGYTVKKTQVSRREENPVESLLYELMNTWSWVD